MCFNLGQDISVTWLPKRIPRRSQEKALLFADVLRPAAVLVIKGWQDELVPFELALLHAGQRWCRRVPPLGDEDDEGERLAGVLQQFLVQREKNHLSIG